MLKPEGLQYNIPASRQVFFNLRAADASKHNTSYGTKTSNAFIYRDKGEKIMLEKIGQLSNRCLYMGHESMFESLQRILTKHHSQDDRNKTI